MGDMAPDRVYGDRREATVAYVASEQGVATVRVAGDRVGRFALAHACRARDVTIRDGQVYVATDDGVLAGPGEFEGTAFDGGAVAVGAGADGVLAGDDGGAVFRYRGDEWTPLGTVDAVTALSGDLVGTSDGVYRVVGDDLAAVGLVDVRDVAADGVPLAATADGLYRLGNGWLREREGDFAVVGTDSGSDRAHAATAATLFARGDDGWTAVDLPVAEPVVDVAYGECVYAVTRDGTFLVEAAADHTADGTGGWRPRALGLPDVTAVAVV